MPSSLQELRRLVNGASLVAKEFAKRSNLVETAVSGDLKTLISSSLKNTLLSATDLAGLTKGKAREFASPRSKETVVFFKDSIESSTITDSTQHNQHNVVDLDRSGVESSSSSVSGLDDRVEVREGEIVKEKIEEIVFDSESSSSSASVPGLNDRGEIREVDVVVQEPASRSLPVTKDVGGGGVVAVAPVKKRRLRERRVPTTPFSRALGFAGLGAGLAWGTLQESTKRLVYGTPKPGENQPAYSAFLSEQNAERLALALCRMRGAALKLGQMLSIQDESLVPAPILAALDIVRQGADIMPKSQLNQVLDSELGPGWNSKLQSFDYEPLAAASIGQVHRAVTKSGLNVAMKIQYPGVADSIGSDIENVKLLLDYTNLIPKGLYLERAMKVAKDELTRECDYELEASSQRRFRELLSDKEGFYVPMVIDDLLSRRVITTELVSGVPIDKVAALDQETRDYVGKKLLELTLRELFVFRFMQTDPNWSNFLYDETTNTINLIDFGAARDYSKDFVDNYLRMVVACASCDKDAVIEMSRRLGFLTGTESEIMLDAHVQAGFVVGLPFSKPGGYDFRTTNITQSVSNLGATMLRHRVTPPPDEAYSLHRKLSGAFLACIKLGAVVPCRDLLLEVYDGYQFDDENKEVLQSNSSS